MKLVLHFVDNGKSHLYTEKYGEQACDLGKKAPVTGWGFGLKTLEHIS